MDLIQILKIFRLIQQNKVASLDTSNVQYKISHLSTNMSIRRTSMTARNDSLVKQNRALKAIELEGSTSLERYTNRIPLIHDN